MPRLFPSSLARTASGTRLIAIVQLACVGLATAILVWVWERHHDPAILAVLVFAAVAAMLMVYGLRLLEVNRGATEELARTTAEERALTAALEEAVASRTSELEDARRVLQRMWRLGQQITLELNPQRVLDRFLEAVCDIAQADGCTVGLAGDDARIRIVVANGIGHVLAGSTIPITGSAMGRVFSSGSPWTVPNIHASRDELDSPAYQRVKHAITGIAIVPMTRRGECIGAVSVLTKEARVFTRADLERIAAMSDLLSVSLENAELVETLRQAEWRFRTLFRAAPDSVLTVHQSGVVREANDAVRDVTGTDPLLVVGRPIADLVVEADHDMLRSALDAAFAGTATRIEVTFHEIPKTTSHHVVSLAMSRLPEADPPSVLLVGRDMTSERDMRVRMMESDRLAAVGELVAGVAHEVNNPLGSISAFAQLLLRDGGLTPAQRESIDVIRTETLRASQVVKDLLAFARRSEGHHTSLDLNGVLTLTLRLRGYQLAASKIQVETDFAVDLPAVEGDARQLQQVCLNLVTNANQAMSTIGGGKLFVTTRGEGSNVVLEIRDTGPGIPDSVKAHIFEPFFTTKPEGEGTGLGLSVSYGIITAHGGTIEVAHTSPAGTTFRVVLPMAPERSSDEVSSESGGMLLRSRLAGLRLLLIDDDQGLRNGLRALGDQRGFTVLTASDGIEGLDLLRSSSVDAVIYDLRMPGMDGTAFYERLRRERPGLAARTVFITGGDVVTAGVRTSGGTTRQPVLSKPFGFEKLEETLVALMRGAPVAGPAGRP